MIAHWQILLANKLLPLLTQLDSLIEWCIAGTNSVGDKVLEKAKTKMIQVHLQSYLKKHKRGNTLMKNIGPKIQKARRSYLLQKKQIGRITTLLWKPRKPIQNTEKVFGDATRMAFIFPGFLTGRKIFTWNKIVWLLLTIGVASLIVIDVLF